MIYLEIIFKVFLIMSAVYTVFHIVDFGESWYKWIVAILKAIWNGIIWLWNTIFKYMG